MTKVTYATSVIKTKYAKILIQIFSDYGLDTHRLIEDSFLPPNLIESKSNYIPQETIKRLIFKASSQLTVHQFSEALSLAFKDKIIPNILHNFLEFKTIGDSLKHVNSIFSQDSPGSNVNFTREYGMSWLSRGTSASKSINLQYEEIFVITYIIELIRILSQSSWEPTKVRLQGQDSNLIQSIVPEQCQIFVDQESTAVLIPNDILQLPIRLSFKDIPPKPSSLSWSTNFSDNVCELIKPYIKEQDLSLEEAAKLFNLSIRSFQRKLHKENMTYRRIKEKLIMSIACELIEDGHSITYISSQLGYTNISHFSRAFKRVSGVSPKTYQSTLPKVNPTENQ
ncbi:helix-turn-helix domain-containing protein [Vibrio sp. T20]|uniref:helix-turn-helix domain-containing protein n=1 Tax=Vibrio sp. T20 TaxID=2588450 RepID=UPI0011B6C8F9|nr:AraC family transcriptional regulator [Vibrio sp. T20]